MENGNGRKIDWGIWKGHRRKSRRCYWKADETQRQRLGLSATTSKPLQKMKAFFPRLSASSSLSSCYRYGLNPSTHEQKSLLLFFFYFFFCWLQRTKLYLTVAKSNSNNIKGLDQISQLQVQVLRRRFIDDSSQSIIQRQFYSVKKKKLGLMVREY